MGVAEPAFVLHAAPRRAFIVVDLTAYASRLPFATVPTWILHPSVTPPMLAVYVALLTFADLHTGECWPSLAAIAERAGVHRATVVRALNSLKALSIVNWSERHDADGQASNRYTVAMDPTTPPDALAAPVDNSAADAPVSRRKRLAPVAESDSPPSQKATRNENQENKSQGNETRASAPALNGRCSRHVGVAEPPACRDCRDARLAAEASAAAEAEAARQSARAERVASARTLAASLAERRGLTVEAIEAEADRESPDDRLTGLRILVAAADREGNR